MFVLSKLLFTGHRVQLGAIAALAETHICNLLFIIVNCNHQLYNKVCLAHYWCYPSHRISSYQDNSAKPSMGIFGRRRKLTLPLCFTVAKAEKVETHPGRFTAYPRGDPGFSPAQCWALLSRSWHVYPPLTPLYKRGLTQAGHLNFVRLSYNKHSMHALKCWIL